MEKGLCEPQATISGTEVVKVRERGTLSGGVELSEIRLHTGVEDLKEVCEKKEERMFRKFRAFLWSTLPSEGTKEERWVALREEKG